MPDIYAEMAAKALQDEATEVPVDEQASAAEPEHDSEPEDKAVAEDVKDDVATEVLPSLPLPHGVELS